MDINTLAFFELLKAGLWGKEISLFDYGKIDYATIKRIAEEQSVEGLITVGLEHVKDVKIPQEWTLQFVGSTLQIESRNKGMNEFVAKLFSLLRKYGIYALLVKGQGIAQCYERPLWRSCGDVDLLLGEPDYKKAKDCLSSLAVSVEKENAFKHLGMTIDGWVVELHGTLKSGFLPRMDELVDSVQAETLKEGKIRAWRDGETDIFLPEQNNDVILIFTHIIKHFYHEGIGLRQLCDWCRLMWTFKDSLNQGLLKTRLKQAGLINEWKVFSNFVVEYLGMPVEAMPLYSDKRCWKRKAGKLLGFILETGNFGHNRDLSYRQKKSSLEIKRISFWRNTSDSFRRFVIFPKNTTIAWFNWFKTGIKAII